MTQSSPAPWKAKITSTSKWEYWFSRLFLPHLNNDPEIIRRRMICQHVMLQHLGFNLSADHYLCLHVLRKCQNVAGDETTIIIRNWMDVFPAAICGNGNHFTCSTWKHADNFLKALNVIKPCFLWGLLSHGKGKSNYAMPSPTLRCCIIQQRAAVIFSINSNYTEYGVGGNDEGVTPLSHYGDNDITRAFSRVKPPVTENR